MLSEEYMESPCNLGRIIDILNGRTEILNVGGKLDRIGNGKIVEGFPTCTVTFEVGQVLKQGLFEVVVKIAEAERIIRPAGEYATPAHAESD